MAGSKGGNEGRGRKRRRRDENSGLIGAIRHPLRREILRRMRDGRKASPSELAKELGKPVNSVAYHVRVLAQYGTLRPSGEGTAKGAAQHFYRCAAMPAWLRSLLDDEEEAP